MPVYKGYKLFSEAGCICRRKSPSILSILEVEENTFRSGCVRIKKTEKGFLTNKHATIDSAKIQQMSLISICFKYQLLQHATDQEEKVICDVISKLGKE